jgi:hypothetical protein
MRRYGRGTGRELNNVENSLNTAFGANSSFRILLSREFCVSDESQLRKAVDLSRYRQLTSGKGLASASFVCLDF